MKKHQKTFIVVLFMMILGITSACNQVNKDDKLKHFKLTLLHEGKVIKHYFDAPDGNNYFVEKNFIVKESEMAPYNMYYIYFNDDSDPLGRGYFYSLKKDLSPKPVIWLNNEEAIIVEYSEFFKTDLTLFNVKTREKQPFQIPDLREYHHGDINREHNHMTFIYDADITLNVSLYDILEKKWKTIYSYKKPFYLHDLNVKSVWGINDSIYFDEAKNDKSPHQKRIVTNIKKYNVHARTIDDFKQNAKILSISPDKTYLAYLDFNKNKTVILNLKNNKNIEMPLTDELAWNRLSNEFAYINDKQDYIVINRLEAAGHIQTTRIDIDDLKNEAYEVMNLQYVGHELVFDLVKYTDEKGRLIDKVKTYSVIEQKEGSTVGMLE
ncbi:MAG: hypothetical protein H0Z33_08795 [Bacillaceae bacterium]|nr:hypothetical protein [Bacillaceae bacterium]